MEKVSRTSLFDKPEPASPPSPAFDFVFETVEPSSPKDEESVSAPEATEYAFQLFSHAPSTVDLDESVIEQQQKRPQTYYFASYTPSQIQEFAIAVAGADVLNAANNFGYTSASLAPDINAGFKTERKKCRPGKNARQKRLIKKQKEEEEKKRLHQQKQNYFFRKKRNTFILK